MSPPQNGLTVTIAAFSVGGTAADVLDATHDAEGRLVIAVRGGTLLETIRCLNLDCPGPASTRIYAAAPIAPGSSAPLQIALGHDGLIYVLYGGGGNSLVLIRCSTVSCDSLELVQQVTLTHAVRDVALAVQVNGRLALMAVLNNGASIILRCTNVPCSSLTSNTLSSFADAQRISATITSLPNNELAVATLHDDGTMRMTRCFQSDSTCQAAGSLSGVNGTDGVVAITAANGRPLFGYFKGNNLAIARCANEACSSLTETVGTGLVFADTRVELAGTVMGSGLPAFVLADNVSRILVCTDGLCSEQPQSLRMVTQQNLGYGAVAATVGPDGVLRSIRRSGNSLRVLRCRDPINCSAFGRPK